MAWSFARSLTVGLLVAAGCADATFDLLPPPAATSGTGGDTPIGNGGETPRGDGGSAGTRAGTGGSGDAGGMGNEGPYGGGGYTPSDCPPPNIECGIDSECGGNTPFCDSFWRRCIECRTPTECPPGMSCASDCPGENQRCEDKTNTCVTACADSMGAHPSQCPMAQGYCDVGRNACVECLEDNHCFKNSGGQYCFRKTGQCVECSQNYEFATPQCQDPNRPVCGSNFTCRACFCDMECPYPRVCDAKRGQCVLPPPEP